MMLSPKPQLLLVAGKNELEAILSQSDPTILWKQETSDHYTQGSWHLVQTGMGALNMALRLDQILREFHPQHVMHIGLSGAHLTALDIGSLVLGQEVVEFSKHIKTAQGEIIPIPHQITSLEKSTSHLSFKADRGLYDLLLNQLKKHPFSITEGIIGGADQFNRDPVFIQKIQSVFHTCCEDMESAAAAQVAYRWKVPYVGIRVISNNELRPDTRTVAGNPLDPKAFHQLGFLVKILKLISF